MTAPSKAAKSPHRLARAICAAPAARGGHWKNAWKKLINCGDVFEIVAGSIVWNDALKIIPSNFK
jgi:hypothetical protein